MAVSEGTSKIKVAVGEYDFAVDGGAVSTIVLRGGGAIGGTIPTGSVIFEGYVDVLTPLTSGGAATIAAQTEAANDVLTAVAVASWTAGIKNVLPAIATGALTANTAVKTTAARSISIVIATAALTAGKFRVVLMYR